MTELDKQVLAILTSASKPLVPDEVITKLKQKDCYTTVTADEVWASLRRLLSEDTIQWTSAYYVPKEEKIGGKNGSR